MLIDEDDAEESHIPSHIKWTSLGSVEEIKEALSPVRSNKPKTVEQL